MMFLTIAQVAVPLALIGWLAFGAPESVLGYFAAVVGISTLLGALALAGLWLAPPWWTPYGLGALLVGTVLVRMHRSQLRFLTVLPARFSGWVCLIVTVGLSIGSAAVILTAVAARAPQTPEVVDVSSPFRGGTFLIAQGGSREIVNGHLMTRNPAVERFRAWRGQSYAIDVVRIDSFGLVSRSWLPADPAAYAIFGTPVYAPCAGDVVSSRGDSPDMPVPRMDRANMLGNYVVLDCAGVWLVLAHFQNGTVTVDQAESVPIGALLGKVGNSGNSALPHLHIHAQRAGSEDVLIDGEPLALTVEGRFLRRNERFSMQ